jgi:hypothetical protein
MYPELCPFNYEKLCIILIYGKIKKPLKSLDLGGFRGFCETTGGERGTAINQTPKNQKILFIYKVSIKSILKRGFIFIKIYTDGMLLIIF